jgi:hypothetical protein
MGRKKTGLAWPAASATESVGGRLQHLLGFFDPQGLHVFDGV